MPYATVDDLIQVEPTITDYGVIDFDLELQRSEQEINRVLNVRWFLTYKARHPSAVLFNPQLLDAAQWRQATVYHALSYHIAPKLTQFAQEGNEDRFQIMMKYYAGRFEHEMDLCLREGVRYDLNDDGTVTDQESSATVSLRLVR
jgi:hypothetical protein